jgi:hypothetical protein
MGDMADYYKENELDMHLKGLRVGGPTKSYKKWTMGDGKKILVSNMTSSHIAHSITLIERRSPWRKDWLKPLKKELSKRKSV